MKYEFEVKGLPVGKQRPRASIINGYARVYTPKKTQSYEALVCGMLMQKYGNIKPLESAIRVEIYVYYQLEKTCFKKRGINLDGQRKLNGEIYPTKKPDIDNIAKSILDALNSVVYRDDSQVVELIVKKSYIEDLPKVKVIIENI